MYVIGNVSVALAKGNFLGIGIGRALACEALRPGPALGTHGPPSHISKMVPLPSTLAHQLIANADGDSNSISAFRVTCTVFVADWKTQPARLPSSPPTRRSASGGEQQTAVPHRPDALPARPRRCWRTLRGPSRWAVSFEERPRR